MATQYKRIFTSGKIGKLEIKNRLCNTASIPNFSRRNGELTQREIDYFVEKAKGGLGIVSMAATSINATTAKGFLMQAALYSDDFISQYKILTDSIRSYGAKSCIQIYHPGRSTHPFVTGGHCPEGPKELPCPYYTTHYPGYHYELMSTERIQEVIQEFAETARRAKEAGFDIIEVQGAHGYLLTAFSSPYFGKRPIDDGYGGSYKENKLKFHRELIRALHEKVGEDFPIGIRFNADDFVEGGTTLDDAKEIAMMLEEMGFDYLGVSAAVYSSDVKVMHFFSPAMYIPPLHLEWAAAAIKEVVTIPVMQYGRVSSPEVAEGILERGTADFVQMNRATWADPHIANKALRGEEEEIRHCLYCNNGCIDHLFANLDCCCSMNPELGRERIFAERLKVQAAVKKKVMIIGGGPAGMACARYAKLRGHAITLFEKEQELGGANRYASKGPRREEFGELTNYYVRQMRVLGIEVRLGEEVTFEKVKEIKPEVAVVATGSLPKIPVIKGVWKPNGTLADRVVTAWEVLGQEKEVGDHTVIVGGNHTGTQVALLLLEHDKKVTIVECLPTMNQDMDGIFVWEGYILPEIKKYEDEDRAEVITGMYVKEIVANGILCEPPGATPNTFDVPAMVTVGAEKLIECDTIVVGTGREPLNHLFRELQGKVPELYAIGDCVKPRWAYNATGEGATLGITI